jgi:hypothetical protein
MTTQIETHLQELAGLWVEVTSEGLRRIPVLCSEIEDLTARGEAGAKVERDLLRRIDLLSSRAEARMAECLAIQTRTGTYSTRGALETTPRVATSGWEG